MATIKTVWTGSTVSDNGLSLKIGNICNTSHFVGHDLQFLTYLGGQYYKNENLYIPFKGVKTDNYYSLTTTTASVELLDTESNGWIELNDSTISSAYTYMSTAAYFAGANGIVSYSDTHISDNNYEIRQTNSLSYVDLTRSVLWTESDTLEDTYTLVNFTSLSNAYNKTATTTVTGSAFTVDATKKVTGEGKITAIANYSGFSENSGSQKFDYTVAASDGAEYITYTSKYTRSETQAEGIELRNTATDVTFNDSSSVEPIDTIYINTGNHTNDESGSVDVLSYVTNTTNNKTVYMPTSVWSITEGSTLLVSSIVGDHESGSTTTISAISGTGAQSGTSKIHAVSKDGKLSKACTDLTVVVGTPSFSGANVNVGETKSINASGLAGNSQDTIHTTITNIEALTDDIIEITKDSAGQFIIKGLASGAGQTTETKWTTSDGAILYLGTITVAAAITITFWKKNTTDQTSDMNWGDSVYVQVTGGHGDETVTSDIGFITSVTKPAGKTGNWYTLSAPTGDQATAATKINVTASPEAGDPVSTSIDIKHISLTLS